MRLRKSNTSEIYLKYKEFKIRKYVLTKNIKWAKGMNKDSPKRKQKCQFLNSWTEMNEFYEFKKTSKLKI